MGQINNEIYSFIFNLISNYKSKIRQRITSFAIWWYMLVCSEHITQKVLTVVGSIVVLGVLTYLVLFHSLWDLKAIQRNMQHSLIWELMLNKFGHSHKPREATIDICFMKDEDTVDHSIVTRWFQKFCSVFKNVSNQARPRSCSKLLGQIWWVTFGEYQASLAPHSPVWFFTFMTLAKDSVTVKLYLMSSKYCKSFYSSVYANQEK